jgi:hypothetical protein
MHGGKSKTRIEGFGAALSLLTLIACAHPPKNLFRPKECDWRVTSDSLPSGGMQILSATTQALYSVGSAEGRGRGYVLLARGQPNWFDGKLVGGGGYVIGAGARVHVWRLGSQSIKATYDPGKNALYLLGQELQLDTVNALLVDRVDSVGGEMHLVGATCIHEFDTTDPSRWLHNAPASVQVYVRMRPDA